MQLWLENQRSFYQMIEKLHIVWIFWAKLQKIVSISWFDFLQFDLSIPTQKFYIYNFTEPLNNYSIKSNQSEIPVVSIFVKNGDVKTLSSRFTTTKQLRFNFYDVSTCGFYLRQELWRKERNEYLWPEVRAAAATTD